MLIISEEYIEELKEHLNNSLATNKSLKRIIIYCTPSNEEKFAEYEIKCSKITVETTKDMLLSQIDKFNLDIE